jgi:hypothetical protein
MMRFHWHDWCLKLGVLLTLLGCGGIAPQARAGCDQPTAIMWSAEEPSHLALADSFSHPSVPNPQPCRGPNCLRAPLAPLAPPATLVMPSQDWACLTVVPRGPDNPGIAYRRDDDPHTPIFLAFRIYHPPR